jgi:hypothetical protein
MPIRKNDRHDLDAMEGKLIRIGHHLWREYKRTRSTALEAALETVWAAKRLYRAELKVEREAEAQQLRDYWEARRNVPSSPVISPSSDFRAVLVAKG